MTLKVGFITSTFVEDGATILNVQMDRPGNEPREVLFMKPLSGAVYVPQEGDTVALDKLESGEYVAVGILNRNEIPNPEHGQQEFSMTLDENTEFSFVKDEDGNYDVTISCSGRLSIVSDDGFDILDDNGYGIVGDDVGNFVWHHEDVEFDSQSTATIK